MLQATEDLTGRILSDHARIQRLLNALEDVARCEEPARARRMLAEVWERAAILLEVLCDAEEEICYPVLHDGRQAAASRIEGAIADHDDMREAVAEARLQEVGCPAWWRAVTAVIRASRDHFSREQQGMLADVRRRLPPDQQDSLGRQWGAFVTARTLDAGLPQPGPPS